MKDVFAQNNSLRSVGDRAQRIAYWVSLIGLFGNAVLFALYILSDDWNALLVANFFFYTLIISLIAISSYNNRHFNVTLSLGIVAIYCHMWATAFYDASTGNGSILSFPILLFVPMCLVLVSGYRFLLVNAVIQGVAVFLYADHFLLSVYGVSAGALDVRNLAALLAILSSLTMTVLAVVSYARSKTDSRLLRLVRETERLAAEDPLTGLKNRRAFMEALDVCWDNQAVFAIAFIDLDKFKPINDQFGHAVGDTVLQVIGHRLNQAGDVACAARFGGDEFAVLIDGFNSMQHLNSKIRGLHAIITDDIDVEVDCVSVGASIGYVTAFEDSASLSELLHAADTAMMRCKSNGLCIAKFDSQLDDPMLASSAMEELFRKALSQQGITGALQPIVSTKERQVVGYELLARWMNSGLPRDPSPSEFIPLAEKLGLLNQLLWKTLEQVLPYLRPTASFLAINVSPSQLSSTTFVKSLKEVTSRFAFPLGRLEIEITEHVAFRNLSENVAVLSELRALGCKIVLDDFGAGYSSLSLLDTLPLDKVKLDKSLRDGGGSSGVLSATIRLIQDLGFECCVEGVENEALAAHAERKGCEFMQGYLFGYPEARYQSSVISLAS